MPQNDSTKCDILILSADLGTGHHQVSVALKEALRTQDPGLSVKISNYFNYINSFINRMLKFIYSNLIKHFSWGYDWFYKATKKADSSSKWQRILNRIGRNEILKLIKTSSPQIIICTFPTPAGVVSQLKSEGKIHVPLVVVITDVTTHGQWIHPMVDAYIVAADPVFHCLVEKGIPRSKIHVTGIPIRPQFELLSTPAKTRKEYDLNPSLFTLLIMGGGEGLMPGIEKICKKLNSMGLPIQLVALTGSNKILFKNLSRLSSCLSIPLKILSYTENIAPLMKASNLLLSKAGGITVFEALSIKLPILLYKPLPGHETCNVNFLLDNKAALMARNVNKAVELIKTALESPPLLKGISQAMVPFSKPSSARDASEIILNLLPGDSYYISQTYVKEQD